MKIFKTIVGIDVAKDTLAVSIYDGKTHIVKEFLYKKKSISKELITKFKKDKESVVFVLECTGTYHTNLAYQLYENGYKVSTLNPFIIKKYSEMRMMRIKTDSADAKLIAEYGFDYQNKLEFFKPKNDAVIHVDNLIKAIDDLSNQKTISKNQRHALSKQAYHSKDILNSYDRHIKFIVDEIKQLNKQLLSLLKRSFKNEYDLLISIPGVGVKVASLIISTFNSFQDFQTAKQACSFAGICPSPYQSGTSVRGKGSISKRGSPFARKILYMGALSATKYNPLIKKQYQRLVENGKPKMQAIVAAANKLLRQTFGVLKSKKAYDESYICIRNLNGSSFEN